MQFLWTLSKKTHTKIKVAHRICPRSATEEIVLSYNGESYLLTLYYYRDGSLWRTRKRHSRISSRRWKMHEITVSHFLGQLSWYTILEVEQETILEIYRFWVRYFVNRGLGDPTLLGVGRSCNYK